MCLFILVCKNRAIHDRAGAATAKGSGGFATGYRTAGQRKRSHGSAVSNAEKQPRRAARGSNDRSGSPCIRSASAGKRQRLPAPKPPHYPTPHPACLKPPKSLPAFPQPEPAGPADSRLRAKRAFRVRQGKRGKIGPHFPHEGGEALGADHLVQHGSPHCPVC